MKPVLYLAIFLGVLSVLPLQAQYFERTFQDKFYNLPTGFREAENGDFLFTVLPPSSRFLSRRRPGGYSCWAWRSARRIK